MNSIKFLGLVLMLTLSLSACNDNGGGNSDARPVADAGVDQHLKTGDVVTLDAARSTDAQHDALTYRWTADKTPIGSAAILSDENSSHPSFTADLVGIYQFSLIVNDGQYDSRASTVTITATATAANALPVAHAGIDQHVKATSPHNSGKVFLDGSHSSDADKEHLNFQWKFKTKPTGSIATLVNATLSHAEFIADTVGSYEVDLIVNDGTENSVADTITITAQIENSAPVAHAGTDQHIKQGAVALINGSDSTDADHDNLTYTWSIQSKPGGSSATLTLVGINNSLAHITLDVEGSYVLKLVVNDGLVDSVADTVTLTAAANSTPHAVITSSPFYEITEQASLNASSSSDADNDSLIYKWHIKHKPANSTVELSSVTAETTTFVLDKNGVYLIELTVSDGVTDSAPEVYDISTRMTRRVLRKLIAAYTYKISVNVDATHEATKIINADTSQITDMDLLISGGRPFNLDISGWDTANVITMHSMFFSANIFNQDLSGWNTDNVMDHTSFYSPGTPTFAWPDNRHPVFKDAVKYAQLIGVWKSCLAVGPFFQEAIYTFNEDRTGHSAGFMYIGGTTCTGTPTFPLHSTFIYHLGRKLPYSSDTVTSFKEVQEIVITDSPAIDENIIAIDLDLNRLYMGESIQTRSTLARPKVLFTDLYYEKQP